MVVDVSEILRATKEGSVSKPSVAEKDYIRHLYARMAEGDIR
ncbi:MAG: hypothetical protein Q8M18_06095 [Bradyrhizobium sp.]|nr:hypothetical protein [Bradyrhizobium sp.]